MSTQTIESRVREQLAGLRGEWKRVADASGVSYSWISKFMNGHIPNPGTRTLNRLQGSLNGRRRQKPTPQEVS